MSTSFLEKEYSIKIPIQNTVGQSLLKEFLDKQAKKQIKYITFELFGEDYGNYEDDYLSSVNSTKTINRTIIDGSNITCDKKTVRRRESELINVKNVYILCEYKESIEELDYKITPGDLMIERHYLMDENNLRWAFERSFKMWVDDATTSPIYFDTHLSYLHVESENCSGFKDFEHLLIQSSLNDFIFKTFVQNINFKDIIKNDIEIKRRFLYKPIEDYKIFAPKLDGIRESFLLYRNDLIFYKLGKSIRINNPLNNNQIFFGCAEFINDDFYLIDILKIFGPNSEYCNVDILDSIKILLELYKLNNNLKINNFMHNKDEAVKIGRGPGYDGALAFGQSSILKLKNRLSIDLLKRGNDYYFKNDESFKENFKQFEIIFKGNKNEKNLKKNLKIIEFEVFDTTLEFLRERVDKNEPNKIEDFQAMLDVK